MFISLQGQIQASVMQNMTNGITVSWADSVLLGCKRLSLEQCWDVPALLGTPLQPLGRGLNSETIMFLRVCWSIVKLQSHRDCYGSVLLLLTNTHHSWVGSAQLFFLQTRTVTFPSDRGKLSQPYWCFRNEGNGAQSPNLLLQKQNP